ncbi:RIC1-domain-containing protein [Dipodascopsis uninucleata]
MYWPISTPRQFSLPRLPHNNQGSRSPSNTGTGSGYADLNDEDSIITIKMARNGLVFAVITSRNLYIYQSRPLCPVAVAARTDNSISNYGHNVNLLIRPDSQLFIVQTSMGYFMTFTLTASSADDRVMKMSFDNISDLPYIVPGPGEEGGVIQHNIKYKMVIKVDAGIESALALEDELLVLTTSPPAAQLIRWVADSKGGPQTRTELLAHMDWFNVRERITTVIWEKAMGLFGWISSNGKGWAVVNSSISSGNGTNSSPNSEPSSPVTERMSKSKIFSGFCFHTPNKSVSSTNTDRRSSLLDATFVVNIAINSRFSLIGAGTLGGNIFIYNVKDYAGHIPLLREIKSPFTSFGKITTIKWSPDGYALFAGYERGWALYSVYGKLEAHSMLAEDNSLHSEKWRKGICDACWTPNGNEILFITPKSQDMWSIEFSKWSLSGNFSWDNISRTLLFANEKLLLYRGHDQSNLTTISHEAILWQEIAIPYAYISDNWPIQSSCISHDGKWIAIAGKHGLGHYSIYSGRWKFFVNENMENEFSVHGGMVWFNNILLVSVDTDRNTHEIRAYSRDRELDSSLVLHVQQIPSSVIMISLVGDSLLVYTYSNTLYQFIVYYNTFQFSLELVGQVSFAGIVHAPARVRAINWILPDDQAKNGNPIDDISFATIVFLIDGKLVMLYPLHSDADLRYDMKVLKDNVEYYTIVHRGLLKNSIWAFDGTDVLVWLEDMLNINTRPDAISDPIRINVDFYPLSFLFDKGIIIGVESNLTHRRNVSFSYSSQTTRTHLFIHHILRHYLTANKEAEALHIARSYQNLEYFGHSLEVMLHDVLDEEADKPPPPEEAILPRVVNFLNNFNEMLDVIVGCTRKTELASWNVLFDIVGSPKNLFEKCISLGQLKTAGGYLLILQTMEQLEDSSAEMIRLFSMAMEAGDWDLCKELARFLTALDNSGETLRETLKKIKLSDELNGASLIDDVDEKLRVESADQP